MPATTLQARLGELLACRNAGNIAPPFSTLNGGVSSAIEYDILPLSLGDTVVCG